jgi:hypothetical protein
MTSRPAPRPRSRRRGCIWALAALFVLAVVLGVLGAAALAAPDLGPAPGGRNNGDTEAAIAANLGAQLAAQLALQEHAVITLSEHDLTVLVRQNNPNPSRFQDPNARIRDGVVVIDTRTAVGPVTVDVVARLSLRRTTAGDSTPQVTATFTSVQVGGLGLPDFVARSVQDRVQQAFDLEDVLASNSVLDLARHDLDCVLVTAVGVRLGFHRPGSPADPSSCG